VTLSRKLLGGQALPSTPGLLKCHCDTDSICVLSKFMAQNSIDWKNTRWRSLCCWVLLQWFVKITEGRHKASERAGRVLGAREQMKEHYGHFPRAGQQGHAPVRRGCPVRSCLIPPDKLSLPESGNSDSVSALPRGDGTLPDEPTRWPMSLALWG